MRTNTRVKLTTLAGAVALVFGSGSWAADDTATQTFTYQVEQNSQVTVSADPGNLTIVPAAPGEDPAAVTDTTTTYGIVNNAGEDSKKLTAAIDADTPDGVTLAVTLEAPTTGVSGGKKTLSTTSADVVTGIDSVSEDGLGITYELSATAAASGMATATTVVVTYTITGV